MTFLIDIIWAIRSVCTIALKKMKRLTSLVLAAFLWLGTVSLASAAPTSTPTPALTSTQAPTPTSTSTQAPTPANVISAPTYCEEGYKLYKGKCRRVL